MLISVFSGAPSTASALSPQQSATSSLQQSLSLSSQQSFVSSAADASGWTAVFASVFVSELWELLLNPPQPVSKESAASAETIFSGKSTAVPLYTTLKKGAKNQADTKDKADQLEDLEQNDLQKTEEE